MIVVFFGVAGSGKDTCADILVKELGFRKESFAAPMKRMVREAFPAFTEEDIYGSSEKRSTPYKQYPFTGPCPECGSDLYEDARDGGMSCGECNARWRTRYVTPRLALQTLGTEWGRRLYHDVWVDAAFSRIQHLDEALRRRGERAGNHPETNTVITDGRYRNELVRSRDLGARCIKLTRGLWESTDSHPSETELRGMEPDAFDAVLDNANLDLKALPGALLSVVRSFVKS